MWVKLVISVGLPPLPTDKEAKAAPNIYYIYTYVYIYIYIYIYIKRWDTFQEFMYCLGFALLCLATFILASLRRTWLAGEVGEVWGAATD